MSTDFDPYYKWLAIPPEEQPPNHYRLLGLVAFESDPDVIDGAAEARVAYLRNKQGGKNADASQKILNEVAAARIILLSDEKRAAYDEQLRATTHDPLAPLPVAEVPQPAAFAPAPVASTPLQTGISAKPIRARRKPQPAWVMPAVICGGALFVLTVVCIAAAAMLGGTDPQTASADSSPGISPKPPRVTPPPVTPKPVDPPVDPAPVDPPPVDPPVDPPVEPTPVDPPPADPMPVDPAPSPFDPPPADPDATDPNATDPGATDPAPVDPPVAEPEKPGKLPVPDSALQQTNQEKMRALFDFKGAKTPAEKLTLASKLGSLADDDGVDAVQRYVLLDAASGLAIEAGHAPTAVEYKRLLAERFEVDPLQTQYDVLMDAAKSFRLGPEIETLVKASMEFISTAMEADRVDLANDVAGATYKLASRRGVAVEARKVAFDQRNQVRDMYASWRKVRDALEGLEATPDDPALNTTAGEYYCFTVGDWQRGIQHLAKSDDTELQPLAKLELDSDGSAEQLKTIGDEWQQLAVKQKGERKIQLLMRSARAYLIAQSIAPPGSDIANALPPIIAKFGDVTQVQNAIIHERRPNGKKVLFIGMGGTERKTAEPAAKRYFVDHHFMKSMDPSKIDFDRYHTIMVGSNGMDYWGNKDRKEPEAFRDYVDFIREGGHLVVFGTFNGRNMEHLKQFGIKTWSTHGSSFVRVGEATDLFFQGAEHLVPESGKLRTAGAFSISTPHTVLLRRDPTKLALATLPVDRGRLTITTCEPNWMGDLWLIKAMVSWVANGTPLPDEVTPDE